MNTGTPGFPYIRFIWMNTKIVADDGEKWKYTKKKKKNPKENFRRKKDEFFEYLCSQTVHFAKR